MYTYNIPVDLIIILIQLYNYPYKEAEEDKMVDAEFLWKLQNKIKVQLVDFILQSRHKLGRILDN